MPSAAVVIRPPTADDAAEILRLQAISHDHLRPWVDPFRSLEACHAWLERCGQSNYDGNLLCRRSDGAILGAVNLSQIHRGPFCSAYLGYWIGAPFARQGAMRGGLTLVLDRAFGPLELHRVEANIQPRNLASIALVRSLGFRCEGYSPRYLKVGGRWCDHERWALLREEWKVKPAARSRPAATRRGRTLKAEGARDR